MAKLLGKSFYLQDTKTVAQELLGKTFCMRKRDRVLRYQIVETEAYLGVRDPACHSYKGRRTERNETMYWGPGHSYVYFIHGTYFCFNVVTQKAGVPEAILIRALAPLEETKSPKSFTTKRDLQTNGPGKLCRHLGITKAHNGLDLTRRELIWLEDSVQKSHLKVIKSRRIGIDYAGHAAAWKLRFYIRDHSHVSNHALRNPSEI